MTFHTDWLCLDERHEIGYQYQVTPRGEKEDKKKEKSNVYIKEHIKLLRNVQIEICRKNVS